MAKKNDNKVRYDNTDTAPWIVKTTTGERVIKESFTNFKDANAAAKRLMEQSTEYVYAGAVRS